MEQLLLLCKDAFLITSIYFKYIGASVQRDRQLSVPNIVHSKSLDSDSAQGSFM